MEYFNQVVELVAKYPEIVAVAVGLLWDLARRYGYDGKAAGILHDAASVFQSLANASDAVLKQRVKDEKKQ